MLAEARGFAASGRPLVIFPEGTRVPHGERPALQAGFAGLYKLLGMPVVPVAVNSGPLYHRGWKRPGTITLHFGEPIEPGLLRDEIEARVIAAINVLNS
jgi:1-acyl-sn-glycerol-3-phosphate acyltransferase